MSWDVSFFALPDPPPTMAEMPKDWQGMPLGSLADIRSAISDVFPTTNWSDPHWGLHDGAQYFLEFNLGDDDPSEGFTVHVRGAGEAAEAVMKLADETGWYALDTTQNEWLHIAQDPHKG